MKNSITSSMKLKNIILLIGAVIGLIGLFVAGKQYLHI
ncbi:MAG: hypothetical protein ACJAWD_000950, partial [Methylophilaceae bacterium]